MAKKRIRIEYRVNGSPSSPASFAEAALDERLKNRLGGYISSKEIRARTDIGPYTLKRWRDSSRLRAHKVKATWFYSRQDLLDILKSLGTSGGLR